MARHSPPIVNWCQYACLRTMAALLGGIPYACNFALGGALGATYFRANGRRRRQAMDNIARSFPDWPRRRVHDTALASMQSMFRLAVADSVHMERCISPDGWPAHVQLGDLKGIDARLAEGEPFLLLTGHCGNWELLGHALSVMGYRLAAVARPIDNPYVNRWIMGVRQAHGQRIITKWGATPVLEEIIEGGGCVGFIADQNAGVGGLFVPFFDRLAASYKSIGLLAMRHETTIVAAHARRIGHGFRYQIDVHDVIEPEDWKGRDDPLFYITARYNHAMERMIVAAPEQYLWLHRRWKSRPRHEREGRAVPPQLVERLRTLPWMTEASLQRIVDRSNRDAGRAPHGSG